MRQDDELRFDEVDPMGVDAQWALGEYFAELDRRFDGGFDIAAALAQQLDELTPQQRGTFVVARLGDDVVACGGVQRHDVDTAELKRMWVSPAYRGHGLGRRMLHELETRAWNLDYQRVVLDTNSALTEAITMYTSAGYATIERYNDNPYARHWFAKRHGQH